jgi:azobenzene reductase
VSGLRVFLLGGSLARPSHTSALLRAAAGAVRAHGAAAVRWDLAERPVPIADPAQHAVPLAMREPRGRELVAAARSADALVLASPLYHSSYSGVLKNALDHLNARDLRQKPVALLSHTGRRPSSQAIDGLRLVVRALLGISLPSQVITVDDDYEREGRGLRLTGSAAEERLAESVAELLWFAERLGGAAESLNGGRSSALVEAKGG